MKKVTDLDELNKIYEKMQKKYGEKSLHSITNGGCYHSPKYCFIFMNPTGRNIASSKEWKGICSPWIGTKNIWKLFYRLNLLDKAIFEEIQKRKPMEWNESFAEEVYQNITENEVYITNLGKCTQIDARPLSNQIYREYLDLLYQEISFVNPEKIFLFGNQVSSIVLQKPVSVSKCRGEEFLLNINEKQYHFYPTFYPVGNGMRNIDLAIDDMKKIMHT